MKRERGSIILEASLVFPIVVLVMLAFSVLVRYFVVYEALQHGMYETTREMSAYYYLYSTTGLEDFSNGISGVGSDARENLDMLAKPFNETLANIRTIADQLSAAKRELGEVSADGFRYADVNEVRSRVQELYNTLDATGTSVRDCGASLELLMESPLEAMTYLLQYAASEGFTWAENSAMNLIGQALLSQHIPGRNLERYAQAYGIDDMHAAMAWNAGGSGDVEMMLSYKFTIRLFGGFDFQVIQRTKARGWSTGV